MQIAVDVFSRCALCFLTHGFDAFYCVFDAFAFLSGVFSCGRTQQKLQRKCIKKCNVFLQRFY